MCKTRQKLPTITCFFYDVDIEKKDKQRIEKLCKIINCYASWIKKKRFTLIESILLEEPYKLLLVLPRRLSIDMKAPFLKTA
jgi:hypothetical protein